VNRLLAAPGVSILSTWKGGRHRRAWDLGQAGLNFGVAVALRPAHHVELVEPIGGGNSMNRFGLGPFARFAQQEGQTGDEFSLDANENEDREITSFDIRLRRFGTRLFGGLNAEEVTAFLDEVAQALYIAQTRNTEMAIQLQSLKNELKALTIKQKSVPPSDALSGADQQAKSIVRHDEQTDDDPPAASRLEVLRSTALQEVEALLHDAQIRAQAFTDAAQERAATILREADELKAQRQTEAEQLVAEATVTAESILTTAREQETSLRRELDRLSESRLRMLDDVWATLNGCQEWLATVDPRRQRPDEPEERLDRVA
jgi:DivIVA domain-containing protein